MRLVWNNLIYKAWSPVYDKFFNSGIFLAARKDVFQTFSFEPESRVLFVGVGTGADLELVDPTRIHVTAIDFSPDMLQQAIAKFSGSEIEFLEMDAGNMQFADGSFDVVVASLILSVVPDADKCFREIERVTKEGGHVLIFDKFKPANRPLPLGKKVLRPFIRLLGTDIGLDFEKLHKQQARLLLEEDRPVMLNGMYRKIVLRKRSSQ